MKKVIIYSGGLDSTVLLYHAAREYGSENILALSFDYNSKHNDQEYKCARYHCDLLKVSLKRIDVKFLNDLLKSNLLKSGGEIPLGHYEEPSMRQTVVPFRNGIMLSIACGYAESEGADKVLIGNHAGDHAVYPDCRATFIDSMNEAMAYGTYNNVNISSPFCLKTKADIVRIGRHLLVELETTYSCYNGEDVQCGDCSTCYERREAFHLADTEDETIYSSKSTFEQIHQSYTIKGE